MNSMNNIFHKLFPGKNETKKEMSHCLNDPEKICPRSYINNKMILVIGKSGAGKDMYTKNLLHFNQDEIECDGCPCKKITFKKLSQYTSRPPRYGEENNTDYIFLKTDEEVQELLENTSIFDIRKYTIMHSDSTTGTWYYATNTNDVNLSSSSYIAVGPSTSPVKWVEKYITHFGSNNIIVLYIDTPDNDVFEFSLERENKKDPSRRNYSEFCRRYLDNVAEYASIDERLMEIKKKYNVPIIHVYNEKATPTEIMMKFGNIYNKIIELITE